MSVIATSATTSAARKKPVARPADPRVASSLSSALVLPRMTEIAGTTPKTMPVTTASSSVKASTGRCSAAVGCPGICVADIASSARTPAKPSASPATAPNKREHHAFGQHLPHEAPVSGAERRPDRQLAAASGGAHQQQVRDVGAGDEEDEEHACLQDVAAATRVSPTSWSRIGRANPVKPLVFTKSALCGSRSRLRATIVLHLRVGLLDRRARAQPRDHLAELVAASGVRHLLRREGERHQRADLASGQLEVPRQDADDLVRLAVHPDVAADDRCGRRRNAPATARGRGSPDLSAPGIASASVKARPSDRLTLERREEGRRDREASDLDRLAGLREVQRAVHEQRRVLDRGGLGLAVDVVGDRDATPGRGPSADSCSRRRPAARRPDTAAAAAGSGRRG